MFRMAVGVPGRTERGPGGGDAKGMVGGADVPDGLDWVGVLSALSARRSASCSVGSLGFPMERPDGTLMGLGGSTGMPVKLHEVFRLGERGTADLVLVRIASEGDFFPLIFSGLCCVRPTNGANTLSPGRFRSARKLDYRDGVRTFPVSPIFISAGMG